MRNEARNRIGVDGSLRIDKEWADDSPGTSLIFAPGLKYYARSDPQGTVYIRSAGDGAELCRLPAPGPRKTVLRFSPDGRLLAVLNLGLGKAQVWGPWRKRISPRLRRFRSDGDKRPNHSFLRGKWSRDYYGFCFSPDSREIVLQQPPDLAIAVFDLATQKMTCGPLPVGGSCHVAFNPKARQLALGIPGVDAEVRDLETGMILWKQQLSRSIASLALWNPDGKALAVCLTGLGSGDVISLWDVASKKPMGNLEGQPRGGGQCVFNHAGSLLASNGWERILRRCGTP